MRPWAGPRRWIGSDRWARGVTRPPHVRVGGLIVWAAFIVFPTFDALTNPGDGVRHWLAVLGAIAFSGGYMWLVVIWTRPERATLMRVIAVGLLALAIALTIGVSSKWGFLFSYVVACAALAAPSPLGFAAVIACSLMGTAATLLGHGNASDAISYGASALGVGLLLTLLRDLRDRTVELGRARAELARTAVLAERERFARDLHDLLGHSLSVIAIKAELAGRLLPDAPQRAAAEVADVESVARSALGEVRDAVSGYRQPTLEGELEGARIALAAAGIIAEFERSPVTLAPEVEAVLAWAVREGATNVIRHSGARRCEVRVQAGADGARVEVVDDGASPGEAAPARDGGPDARVADPDIADGNGLAGLRERAAAVRGRLEAGSVAGGGFRLSVTVPVGTQLGRRGATTRGAVA